MMVAPGFGPVKAVNDFRLCDWASRTVAVREGLNHTFGQLKTAMNESMGVSERSVSSFMRGSTSFSQQQPMSSVTSSLNWIQRGLTCMERAMVIHCPFRHHRRCHHHHHHHQHHHHDSPLPKLYRPHVLPDNVGLLRSRRLFRQMYHDAAFLLQQLRASLEGSESQVLQEAEGEGDCSSWRNNSAMVLVLSFLHVREGQSFLENVSSACD